MASDLPEIRELVNDGASAILVPPGDVASLERAISFVLLNDEVTDKMGSQNLNFAKRENWSAVAKAYEDAYLALINK